MQRILVRYILLSGLVMLFYNSSFAQSVSSKATHSIDIQLNTCLRLKTGQSTAGMVTCTTQAKDAWNEELNKYYKLLMALLNPQEKEKLKISQRNWITFRDSENAFSAAIYNNLSGTMWRPVAANEQMELVKQRAHKLKEYYETLKGNK